MMDQTDPNRDTSPAPAWPAAQDGMRFWTQVRGQTYGPYSLAQIAGFLAEGRLTPSSQVARMAEGPFVPVREIPALGQALQRHKQGLTPRHAPHIADEAGANMFLFTDIRSGAGRHVPSVLDSLGPWSEIATGLYILRTTRPVGHVRNSLSPIMQKGDLFVVIDATRDRFAWLNVGPEVEVMMRSVWNRSLSPSETARA